MEVKTHDIVNAAKTAELKLSDYIYDSEETFKPDRDALTTISQFGNRETYVECLSFDRVGTCVKTKMSKRDIIALARKKSGLPAPKDVRAWLKAYKGGDPNLMNLSSELGLKVDDKQVKKVFTKYVKTALQPRDLRQLDPGFIQKPAIWVRQSSVIVSLEDVRSIVFHDEMYIFDPENPAVKRCSQFIQETLASRSIDDVFLPFEFRALEGFLVYVTTTLEAEYYAMSTEVERSTQASHDNMMSTVVMEEMRMDKQKLSQFQSRAKTVHDVLAHLLDDDDDLANLYLTEKHRNPFVVRQTQDHEEAELLIELYLQSMADIVNKAKLLDDEVENTEDLVAIRLDNLRNKLIMLQMVLSVVSLGVAIGAMVAGLFGMNLPIPIFEADGSEFWFLGVSLLIIGFLVFIPWASLSVLRKRDLYSSLAGDLPLG